MHVPGPLDALPWLLGAAACGITLFSGLAKEPPRADTTKPPWDKEQIRNDFAGRRFRARKNALTIRPKPNIRVTSRHFTGIAHYSATLGVFGHGSRARDGAAAARYCSKRSF